MNIKNKKGVTLLELMTVIAIVGIMTGVSLIFLSRENREKKEVEMAAQEVAAALREAQNAALTGKAMEASGEYPCRFVFQATANSSNYSVSYHYYEEEAGGCSNTSSMKTYASYTLKNGVKFDNSNYLPATFSIPWGTLETTATDPQNRRYVVVKNNTYYTICACKSGKIKEEKGRIDCAISICN